MARRAQRPVPKWNPRTQSWHAFVTVGTKPNGRPDQVHVERKDYDDCDDEIDKLWTNKKKGIIRTPDARMVLPDWIDVYLNEVLPRRTRKPVSPDTIRLYRGWNRRWIRPHLTTAVGKLQASHLEQLYSAMGTDGLSGASQRSVHYLIQGALEVARRRGYCERNAAKDVDDPPQEDPPDVQIFTVEEARRIIEALDGRRTALRYILGLTLATRQGETLGLQWRYVTLDGADPDIKIEAQLIRRVWEHGCRRPCGKVRGVDCPDGRLPLKAGESQVHGGLVLKPPKAGSRRAIHLPKKIVGLLREHRKVWAADKLKAGTGWLRTDLAFTDELGRPIDPKADREEWRAVLAAAKVDHRRLHDMRHTAATMIHAVSELGVAQEILGHSSPEMTRRYSHLAEELTASDAARAATDSSVRQLFG